MLSERDLQALSQSSVTPSPPGSDTLPPAWVLGPTGRAWGTPAERDAIMAGARVSLRVLQGTETPVAFHLVDSTWTAEGGAARYFTWTEREILVSEPALRRWEADLEPADRAAGLRYMAALAVAGWMQTRWQALGQPPVWCPAGQREAGARLAMQACAWMASDWRLLGSRDPDPALAPFLATRLLQLAHQHGRGVLWRAPLAAAMRALCRLSPARLARLTGGRRWPHGVTTDGLVSLLVVMQQAGPPST